MVQVEMACLIGDKMAGSSRGQIHAGFAIRQPVRHAPKRHQRTCAAR
jgi:hypothetical protein